jgi:hypothetical protein
LPSKIHHFNIKTPQNTSKHHFPIKNTSKAPFSYQKSPQNHHFPIKNRLKTTIFLSKPPIFLLKPTISVLNNLQKPRIIEQKLRQSHFKHRSSGFGVQKATPGVGGDACEGGLPGVGEGARGVLKGWGVAVVGWQWCHSMQRSKAVRMV